jgi:hypothetical protein
LKRSTREAGSKSVIRTFVLGEVFSFYPNPRSFICFLVICCKPYTQPVCNSNIVVLGIPETRGLARRQVAVSQQPDEILTVGIQPAWRFPRKR